MCVLVLEVSIRLYVLVLGIAEDDGRILDVVTETPSIIYRLMEQCRQTQRVALWPGRDWQTLCENGTLFVYEQFHCIMDKDKCLLCEPKPSTTDESRKLVEYV